MLPNKQNVRGVVTVPGGIRSVLGAVQQVFGESAVSIYRSGYDGAETLRVRTDFAELDSDDLRETDQHLLGGAVAGSLDEVARVVQQLSEALAQAGIAHQFEVYVDGVEAKRFTHAGASQRATP